VSGGAALRVLDTDVRLSRSVLWNLQRDYFVQEGLEAWRTGVVPQFITTNAFMARAYAQVIAGFCADCEGRPVHIVELGAGSGRLAYAIVRALLATPGITPGSFRYILTDLAAKNLAHTRRHPAFRELIARGVVDFAPFDLQGDGPIAPQGTGRPLPKGPVVVIANYVFDSVPVDAFVVRDGVLHEARVTVQTADPVLIDTDPALIETVKLRYRTVPAAGTYYDHPTFDAILDGYRTLRGTRAVRFPIVALRALERLAAMSDGRMLLLSADKGSLDHDAPALRELPALARHGSFSMSVNYHAVSRWFALRGGRTLPPASDDALLVAGFLAGPPGAEGLATRRAFHHGIRRFGPADFFSLKRALTPERAEPFTLQEHMAWMRLSGDPEVLRQHLPLLTDKVLHANAEQRRGLRPLVRQIWSRYLDIGENDDLAYAIGVLLCATEEYREALVFFRRSTATTGLHPETQYNIALCHHGLDEPQAALEEVEQLLARHPGHDGATRLRDQLTEPPPPHISPS
jgi:hypothetical protein